MIAREDYRTFAPVEPVEPVPVRFSQTLLAKEEQCPRSAYLYVKYSGGTGSHPMDVGTAGHAVFERLMLGLIEAEEKAYAPDDPGQAASLSATVVDEVLRDRPDLVVTAAEADGLREAAYHWAVGNDVDPETVTGIERLFVLELADGTVLSGRIDLLAELSRELAQVVDYKVSFHIRSQEEYDTAFQPWLYAAFVLFGTPVDVRPCDACRGEPVLCCVGCGSMDCYPGPTGERIRLEGRGFAQCTGCGGPDRPPVGHVAVDCSTCEGRGYLEVPLDPIGADYQGVLTTEVYPRYLREEGGMQRRELLLSRTAVADFLTDVERQAARLRARFESWDFPARHGSWCSMCPAAQECPIPVELRDYAGEINTREQAEEAWERVQVVRAQIAAVEKEVKNFAKAHDVAVRVGDFEWRWGLTEGRALKRAGRGSDWDGLQAAVVEAAEFGVPFSVSEWVKPTVSSGFKKSKVSEVS